MKIKNTLYYLLVFIIFFSCINIRSFGSGFVNPVIYKNDDALKDTAEVNENVLKLFYRMYDVDTGVTWATDKEENAYAYFKKNNKMVRAVFNRQGEFVYSISIYCKEELPEDIFRTVSKKYFNKSIAKVIEVNTEGKTAYLINLEDNASWLTIKYLDGIITEERTFLK